MKLTAWLRQPFPLETGLRHILRTGAAAGTFVTLFLFLLRPFGIRATASWQFFVTCLYFGLVTAGAMLLFGAISWAFPRFFQEKDWTVGREILTVLGLSMLIGTANMFLAQFLWKQPWSWQTFLYWQWVTLMVGLVYGVLASFVKEKTLGRRHMASAEKMSAKLSSPPPTATAPTLTLTGDNQGEKLALPPAQLLYLEAADNYVRVYFSKNDQPEQALLRSSLKNMEAQLAAHPRLFRCHRTYLVNLDRVQKVSGNAQGYKLHLRGTDFLVPVSRSLNKKIGELL